MILDPPRKSCAIAAIPSSPDPRSSRLPRFYPRPFLAPLPTPSHPTSPFFWALKVNLNFLHQLAPEPPSNISFHQAGSLDRSSEQFFFSSLMLLDQNIGRRADFDIACFYSSSPSPLTENTPEREEVFALENHSLNPTSHLLYSAHCFHHFKLGVSFLVWMFRNSKCCRFEWAEETRLGEKRKTAGQKRALVDHQRTNGRSFLLLDITHIIKNGTTSSSDEDLDLHIPLHSRTTSPHLLMFP